jgi:RNA polymerase sigma factor (sigma-70 family)
MRILSLNRQEPLGDGDRVTSRLSREQLCRETLGDHRRQYGGRSHIRVRPREAVGSARGSVGPSQVAYIHDVVVVDVDDDPADEALLVAGRRDGEAFGLFYSRRVNAVLAFFLRRTGDRELAADLTAETFAAALAALPRYRPDRSAALAWLFTIAHRKLVDSIRRGQVEDRARKRLGLQALVFSDEDIELVEHRAAAAAEDSALRALEKLSSAQRAAIEGRVLQEAQYDELARRLKCSESVARKRVSRGLAELRTKMKEA